MNDTLRTGEYTVHFSCGQCGSVLESLPTQGGQPGRCPTCGFVLQIPHVDPRTGLSAAAGRGQTTAGPGAAVHAYAAAGHRAPEIRQVARGTWLIICPRCREQSEIAADRCTACGVPFTLEGTTPELPATLTTWSAVALLLGVLSIPVAVCAARLGLAVAILGSVASWLALQRFDALLSRNSRTVPRTALGLALIGLAVSGIRILKWL